MTMTLCRGCADRLAEKYKVIESEDTQAVGAHCSWCHRWFPAVSQYDLQQPWKQKSPPAEGPAKKDTRARYREPFREGW